LYIVTQFARQGNNIPPEKGRSRREGDKELTTTITTVMMMMTTTTINNNRCM
jgi:hypothetical protein